jgi:hypothetical protein
LTCLRVCLLVARLIRGLGATTLGSEETAQQYDHSGCEKEAANRSPL